MIISKLIMMMLFSFLLSLSALAQADTDSSLKKETLALATYQEAQDYLLGRNGKSKSAERAAVLFKSLAEKNWSPAQHMLGNLYYQGKGVEQNNLLAYKWLSIATRNNIHLAEAILDKRKMLQASLSSKNLQLAEAWIANWQTEQGNEDD